MHSPFGRVLVAIRDNTARARALGYPAHRYKMLAFVLSAFLAGLGGGLFAVGHGFVSLDTLHWTTSGKGVVIVVLGGIGTLWGGVVGAALVVRLEDVLSLAGFARIGLVTGGIFVARGAAVPPRPVGIGGGWLLRKRHVTCPTSDTRRFRIALSGL